MNDPYKILGVSPNSSDDEIKSAYKKLVKKYHPDRFQDETMAELANEKMTEINTAYDQIMDSRKNGGSAYTGGYGGYSYSYSQSGGGNSGVNYQNIRAKIHAGRLNDAENDLSRVAVNERNAEWYFLKGTVCYQRGWLNEAYSNIARAAQLEPQNREYQTALNQLNRQRSGYMSGYNSNNSGSLDTCDMCSSLLCADCCCEAMGGDLIPCC